MARPHMLLRYCRRDQASLPGEYLANDDRTEGFRLTIRSYRYGQYSVALGRPRWERAKLAVFKILSRLMSSRKMGLLSLQTREIGAM